MTSATVQGLRKAGITARDYKGHPRGIPAETFTVSIDGRGHPEGTILVHEGAAETVVRTSKRHRQAVVRAVEKPVTIVRELEITLPGYYGSNRQDIPSGFHLRNAFPINLPQGTRYRASKAGEIIEEKMEGGGTLRRWKGNVSAHRPGSVQTFLMGMDETHNFIAALPHPVDSVRDAHTILRPTGIGPKARRQGEWFFEPVDPVLNRILNGHGLHTRRNIRLAGTTHVASELVQTAGMMFVRGRIVDRRTGRHRPLQLGRTWHRATHNTETVVRNPRARTWD